MTRQYDCSEIAIIGMACRFPGARSVEEFWRNLREGVESLTLLTDEELRRSGVDPATYRDPSYVRRASVLEDIESFDAEFFGYSPAEARLIDPQQRLFMECAWQALERAGYDPKRCDGPIGVFSGAKTNTYLFNIVGNRELMASLDNFRIAVGNDLASMATQISYRFNLTGPSYALHTACSTSLVAVHLACQSLLLDECRMALAGGAAVNVPQRRGYLYQPGGLLSPDGSCRSFSAQAGGTAFGNGAGVVVLKRLEDALADGDPIHALILGTATNNDGAEKASYTAPGVDGQTNVILEALACAGIDAQSLSYMESHGTATPLGDSIEILALKQAFKTATAEPGFCALGAVKSNIGHLETAAGVAGLIKTALALKHRVLPPSLHCEHPVAELEGSPFYVNTQLRPWPGERSPRRAGLSSFGIGSTNAHVILEEPPPPEEPAPSRPWQLLLLSTRSAAALEQATANIAAHLREDRVEGAAADEAVRLADTAYTLQVGRRQFAHRRAVVCRDLDDAAAALEGSDSERVFSGERMEVNPPVAFLLPGLGDQAVGMARELYRTETTFREWLDRCAELLEPELELDLREVIYPPAPEGSKRSKGEQGPDLRRLLGRGGAGESESERRLARTEVAQPTLFAIEYALAQLWMEWGIRPRAMIGYSLGEYVAACLAGVLSLDDALTLVARRARMIGELPAGAMLGVSLPAAELEAAMAEIGPELSLAASNGPSLAVAAGDPQAVAELERRLGEREVACRRLTTTHAFHSRSLEPLGDELTAVAKTLSLKPPEIPYLSNLTGTWITPEEATDPSYWARHMCRPVRFEQGARELLADERRVLLELGSGQSLSSFVKVHPAYQPERTVLTALPGAWERRDDAAFALATLGRLWLAGVEVDWSGFYARERRRRRTLPTYPFERRHYWVDPDDITAVAEGSAADGQVRVTLDKQEDLDDWLYHPVWEAVPRPEAAADEGSPGGGQMEGCWLLLGDSEGSSSALAEALRESGREVVEATCTDRAEDYVTLLESLRAQGRVIRHLVHLAGLTAPAPDGDAFAESWRRGFLSLLYLAQAVGRLGLADPARPLALAVVTAGSFRVTGDEALRPESALAVGPCKVIPQEFPGLTCRQIDIFPDASEAGWIELLAAELGGDGSEELVAYRQGERFVRRFERLPVADGAPRLKERGTYLLTGGLGGLGMTLAEHLAHRYQARLVLIDRSPLPEPEAWSEWLEEHGDDDPLSVKIRKLRALGERGAEILALTADAADVEQMTRARDRALERFGTIDGVVHLAGIPGGGVIQLKTPEAAEAIVVPKVRGALVLAEVLRELQPDFVVLYSSIASILGEFGQVDYCGANAFLDVFASHWRTRSDSFVVTVNWDVWREVGLAVYTEVPDHLKAWRREMLEKGLLSREGVEVFERILGCEAPPQVIVSAQELHGRIELGRSFTGEHFLRQLGGLESAPAVAEAPRGIPASGSEVERTITRVWQRVLGRDELGLDDNFFDLGGNSLIGLQLVSEISRELGIQLLPVTLFERPSIRALTRHLAPAPESAAPDHDLKARRTEVRRQGADREIAIIGMSGRFPGARTLDELWRNLCDGIESVTVFSDEELQAAGVEPELFQRPEYVRLGAVLDDVDQFDAALFGYSPREAEVMDPQHRVFLECAWEALERAGYDADTWQGLIGVYAGCNLSTYLLRMYADPGVRDSVNTLQAILGNDKDSLTTTVSYKLNLRGPSVAVQTFCSTSLVAVHTACRSLRHGECDMALAGGIRIVVPERQGYLYEEGGISPPDGHTRPFDAGANGTLLGQGVGIVVLKRLADALADGDPIHAVIRGTAMNNDGSLKAGYTAPSVAGQAEAVAAAYEDAGVDPETISYLEAHGSATELGDPIEVTALTQAFRTRTDQVGFCRLGSVKGNFGHLDRAAGVTGLIKTVLALEHRQIPPSINFHTPNPQIDFAASPFCVNDALSEWHSDGEPRRAAVNSLGIGGTNVHVVLEQAPEAEPSGESRQWQLLVLSAKTESALEAATANLAACLKTHPDCSLGDAAYTLQVGRRAFGYRRFALCHDPEDAVAVLEGGDPRRSLSAFREEGEPPVAFLFPGLGGQYVTMGRDLYRSEPAFRSAVDRCSEILRPYLDCDVREVLYPEPTADDEAAAGSEAPQVDLRKMLRRGEQQEEDEATARLNRTQLTQPVLFVVEYALAQLWMEWGILPQALVGYSLGEYVAACLAGVLSLEDALKLVAERARLIGDLPAGSMLAVALPEDELRPLLGPELSLSAVNGPEQSVAAGPEEAIATLERELAAKDVVSRRLQTSHAFHSQMMEPLYDAVAELAAGCALHPPRIPYLSNLTGTWITAEEATDPAYWARHMCQPVRFSTAIEELVSDPQRIFLELGPGGTLASLLLQHPAAGDEPAVMASLRHVYETQSDVAYTLSTLGKLWLLGVPVDWRGFYRHEHRRRLELPTYPFERQRYWIDAVDAGVSHLPPADGRVRFYLPSWQRSPLTTGGDGAVKGQWLLFTDPCGLGSELARRLREAGGTVSTVRPGEGFRRLGEEDFCIAPGTPEDYATLVDELGTPPRCIVHLWSVGEADGGPAEALEHCRELGFDSLLALARALGRRQGEAPVALWVISDGLHDVTGQEALEPAKATVLGACAALGREAPGVACRSVDVLLPGPGSGPPEGLADRLLAEIADASAPLVAYRGHHRWLPALAANDGAANDGERPALLREGGTYLITNGFGGLGRVFAEYLVTTAQARLVLVEPPGFPPREQWDEWLSSDDSEGRISSRIQQLRSWEAAGAQVLATAVELGDRERVRELLAQAKARFGPIRGLVHVAEEAATGSAELGAVRELLVLDELLRDHDPEFCFLVSPLAASDGVAAANHFFLDAFAGYRAGNAGGRWSSITWEVPESGEQSAVLGRLFALAPLPQVIVSARSMAPDWSRLDTLAEAPAPAPAPQGFYPRPSLRVEYAAPRSDQERAVVEIWQQLLGVGQVGIHDSFLDLGGDSLLAARLVTRMRSVFDLELPIRLLFEASTVAELVAAVERMREQEEEREMREMLERIKQLPEEELEQEIRMRQSDD